MIGRNRVYRGGRAAGTRSSSVLLFVIVLILLVGIGLFSMLPQYLVYHEDGVEMVVPYLEESGQGFSLEGTTGPQPYAGAVYTTVQASVPDYSDISFGGSAGLDYLQALYVPYSKVTAAGVDSMSKEAQRSSIHGLVLQVKDGSGKLAYMSTTAEASSYGTNNSWDMTETIAALKADGWFLAAEVSCGVDAALAKAKPELTLRDMTGNVYADSVGTWVDPWNTEVRSYIVNLCSELLQMGFDEIILTNVEHPASEVVYTREVASSLGREACVMSFSVAVRKDLAEVLRSTGGHLSAELRREALNGSSSNGQSFEYFLKVFDRLVIKTDAYSEDVQAFLSARVDSTLRFVPKMDWSFAGGSWIMGA